MNMHTVLKARKAGSVAVLVDNLGAIKAQIAALKNHELVLRNALVELGAGSYSGTAYDASVSIAERGTLDMAAVREKLSPQFIAAHTNVTEVTTVKVVARKGNVSK